MSVDQMSVNQMSVNQMSVNQMSVNQMSVDQMSIDQMSIDQMSVDQMAFDQMTWSLPFCQQIRKVSCSNCSISTPIVIYKNKHFQHLFAKPYTKFTPEACS
jgi:hypothetical protein